MDITIRNYHPDDQSTLLNLIDLNTPKYFAPEEKSGLVTYLDQQLEDYFVVEVDSKIVGCGGINYDNDGSVGIISWDIIHPEYQGKGIGKRLLEHRLKIMKSMPKIRKIIVRTSQLTDKFYEKSGFKLIEVKKDYWAKGFDLYHMEIELEEKEM